MVVRGPGRRFRVEDRVAQMVPGAISQLGAGAALDGKGRFGSMLAGAVVVRCDVQCSFLSCGGWWIVNRK